MQKNLIHIEDYSLPKIAQAERRYLQLGQPNREQRFRFQRWKDQICEVASQKNFFQVCADLQESRKTYSGFALDGGLIRFSEWRNQSEYSVNSYAFDGRSIYYRNLKFESGDIILCNRARHSDGMFTTLVEGELSFAHVAVYVLLEYENRLFPAVIEIHHEGVRAVPLNVYLSRSFSTYAEVYRDSGFTCETRKRLAAEAEKMMSETHGFDILMDESQEVYFSCAHMAATLYRRAGALKIQGKSRYSLRTRKNLEFLGVQSCAFRDLLMPDDFSRNPDLRLMGVIDNGEFLKITARNLMKEKMQWLWQNKLLTPSRLPWNYKLIKFAVESVQQRKKWLGSWVARQMGCTLDSFPSGPSTFLALVPEVEKRLEEASKQIASRLAAHRHSLHLAESWEAVVNNPEIKALVDECMARFEELFAPHYLR